MDSNKKKIAVLGSLNYDVFLKIDRLPKDGETIAADDNVQKAFGGKGANQAVACARVANKDQVQVSMLGQLGNDSEGAQYMQYLSENNIDSTNVTMLNGQVTGQAYILSNTQNGENSIIIIGAANQAYSELKADLKEAIKTADVLLLQMEIPQHINLEAAKCAKENEGKAMVILDLGGKDEQIDQNILPYLDYISPNQTELSKIFGPEFKNHEAPENDIAELIKKYPNLKFLYKQGEKGSTLFLAQGDKIESVSVGAYNFSNYDGLSLVDTTGAGDAFTGAFAVGLLEQGSGDAHEQAKQAMTLGTQTAFLAISRYGAGPAMPLRAEIEGMEWK